MDYGQIILMDTPETTPAPAQPPVSAPATNQVHGEWQKASILKRFVAVLLDSLVLLPVNLVFGWVASSTDGLAPVQYLGSFVAIAYSVYFLSTSGATLGKKWMKIRVVKTNGQNLTVGDALLREVVGKFVSGLVLGLGYLWAIWDKNKQTWHDKIAGTYVVTQNT